MNRNIEIPGYGIARIINREAPGCLAYLLVIGLALVGISGLSKKSSQYGEARPVGQPTQKRSPIEQTPVQSKPVNRYAAGEEIVKSMPFGKNIEDEQSRQESQPEPAPQSSNPEGMCGQPLPSDIESGNTVKVFTSLEKELEGTLVIVNDSQFIFYPQFGRRLGCDDIKSMKKVSQE